MKINEAEKNSGCCMCMDISCSSKALSDEQIDFLTAHCMEGQFQKNENLIRENTYSSNILYLRRGLVKEFITSEGGKEQILRIVKGRTYVGLDALFGNRVNRYSYTALTPVKVCFIETDAFKQLLLENGKFAFNILASVSSENVVNVNRLTANREKQISGKVADALLYFSGAIFENTSFELPLTRKEIAHMAGVSRESVTKQLISFEEEGLITLEGNRISLLTPGKLEIISRYG